MSKKKTIKKIEYIEYLTIGLTIGLILSYSFQLNPINGVCIGISLGLLLQKINQEKKILLAIYILSGLLIGCLVATVFDFSRNLSTFSLSIGMLLGTVVYLIVPNSEKKGQLKSKNVSLIWLIILGIILGSIFGFVCYRLIGMCFGIGLGMILGIIYYLKKVCNKKQN